MKKIIILLLFIYSTNAHSQDWLSTQDNDHDGFWDSVEIWYGSDPTDSNSTPDDSKRGYGLSVSVSDDWYDGVELDYFVTVTGTPSVSFPNFLDYTWSCQIVTIDNIPVSMFNSGMLVGAILDNEDNISDGGEYYFYPVNNRPSVAVIAYMLCDAYGEVVSWDYQLTGVSPPEPTPSPTPTPTQPPDPSPTPTPTATPVNTPDPSPSPTSSPTPGGSEPPPPFNPPPWGGGGGGGGGNGGGGDPPPNPTAIPTAVPTVIATDPPFQTPTPGPTNPPWGTATPTPSPTGSPYPTPTHTPTETPTPSPSPTPNPDYDNAPPDESIDNWQAYVTDLFGEENCNVASWAKIYADKIWSALGIPDNFGLDIEASSTKCQIPFPIISPSGPLYFSWGIVDFDLKDYVPFWILNTIWYVALFEIIWLFIHRIIKDIKGDN